MATGFLPTCARESWYNNEPFNHDIQHTTYYIRNATYDIRTTSDESIMQNKPNLLKRQMNVSSVLTKYYENAHLRGRRKNKPNQTQLQAQSKPIRPNSNPTASGEVASSSCVFEITTHHTDNLGGAWQ